MSATTIDQLAEEARVRKALPDPEAAREIRVRAGVSRRRLAEAIGVSQQSVAFWEAGTNVPRGRNLFAYSEILIVLGGAA